MWPDLGRRQLEAAAGLTLSRGHYNVEIEHLLAKLVEAPGGDVSAILKQAGLDAGRVLVLSGLPEGAPPRIVVQGAELLGQVR